LSAAFLFGLLLLVLPVRSGRADALFPVSAFKMGYQIMPMHYVEPDTMHYRGVLHGVFASWTGYLGGRRLMLSAEAEALGGEFDYGAKPPYDYMRFSSDELMLGGRLLAGRGFASGALGIAPYAGIGVRRWKDHMNYPFGYDRRITHFYLPVGMRAVYRLDERWSVGGTVEGDLALRGFVDSLFVRDDPSLTHNLHNTQRFADGGGLHLSAFAERDFDGVRLGLEPYFRYWSFAGSDFSPFLDYGRLRQGYEQENEFYQ